jgi:hypothetical protein
MEDLELKKIWNQYDEQIASSKAMNLQSWALHLHCVEMVQNQKAASKLGALARFKGWAVALGVLWILFLGMLVYGNRFSNPYFSFSVSAILFFTVYAVIVYIKHILLIKQIDYDGSVTAIQEKLARLETSTINSTRIMWLQMPFYTTFFWHSSWIHFNEWQFWLTSFPITLGFTFLAIYLYQHITADNLHKKWVRALLMSGPEYKSVLQAAGFLKEIAAFKKEMA